MYQKDVSFTGIKVFNALPRPIKDISNNPKKFKVALKSYPVAYPGIFFGGCSTNSVEDRGQRGRGSWGGSPLVRGSGGSCNLVQ